MRNFLAGGIFVLIGVMIGSVNATKQMGERQAINHTRAGVPRAEESTRVTVSGVSAATATLTTNLTYEIVCNTDVYFEWGTSAPTADSNSSYLPQNTIIHRSVLAENSPVSFFAAVQVSAGGTCFLTALD